MEEAIEHAIAAKDCDRAAGLIEMVAPNMLVRWQQGLMQSRIRLLPDQAWMEKTMTTKIFNSVVQAVPFLIDFPAQRYWIDYDSEADVLYISFQRPQKATDSRMSADGMLFRYRDKQLVGITVLEASTRSFNKRMKKPKVKS